MPKLKELTMQGFKSFADPLTIVFPTGITAIIGPNGSGKSNVADAVRWVLGEQRMSTLRGKVGEDMIFAGSKKRARSGMARVSLVFDNSDGWLPVDFSEVIVERRNYRDGSSDYILNGSKVRLMDLRDLLDRAGLGRDAYLTIGQGLVDQVLSLRPSERMALFEQAAGIAPYRSRREEALRRLEETRHNLERVRDIVGEIEPRLRRLRRQVERAEQHEQLTADLKERLRIWYGYRWGYALNKLESARQRVLYHDRRVAARRSDLDALSQRIVDVRRRMVELRSNLAQFHRESGARHAEAEKLQRELAVARERRRLLRERREEGAANLVPLRSALEAEEEELDELRVAVEEAAGRLEEARAEQQTVEATYRRLEDRRRALIARQEGARARALEVRHRLADRESRLEGAAERERDLEARVAQLEADLASAMERRRAQQRAVEEARRALEGAEGELAGLEAKEEGLRTAQEELRAEVERLRRELAGTRSDYQQLSARLEALERLHEEGAGLYAGVRAVIQAAERGQLRGLPGTFASLVRVPPELDRALEAALGGQLQNVVARGWDDARAGIEWLKRHRAGRATFLPLDTLRPPRPLDVPAGPGVVGLAADLVEYDGDLHPAVMLLLGRVAVTEHLDAARALHRRMRGGYRIVTLEGELLNSSGSLTGGQNGRKGRGGSLLARERERRELPGQVAALEEEADAVRQALERREAETEALSRDLREAAERRRSLEGARRDAQRRLERAVGDLEKLVQETEWQERRLEEAAREGERLAQLRERLREEAAEAREELAEAQAEMASAARALEEVRDDETARAVSEGRTRVALLEQERRNRGVLLETREREAARLEGQIEAQERRLVELGEELELLAREVADLQGRYDAARGEADALAARVPPLEEKLAGLEEEQERVEGKAEDVRRVLHDAEGQRAKAEMDAHRREDQVRALRKEIEGALEVVIADLPDSLSAQQPLPLGAIAAPLPTVVELPEGLEGEIRDLRTQIRRLEPVNVTAREEYEEVATRHTFLREQSADLETASAHLRKVIAELDELMDTAFRTTFKAIASEFSRVFRVLFNGGAAKLHLETDDEGEIAGVEISARPPGKRTSGLGMLSGGERTLTAVALLFAVMHVSPTPFCILDEVDAMLDEANVGRFRAMLADLGAQTQFVIITHNRGTVEAADTIYGVSMGDDGVSQVLSLSLEDLPTSEVVEFG
jgi:chromosome segregation protein